MPHRAGARLGGAPSLSSVALCWCPRVSGHHMPPHKTDPGGKVPSADFPNPFTLSAWLPLPRAVRRPRRSCSSDGQSSGEEGPLRSGCGGERASRQTLKVLRTQGRGGAKHWAPGMTRRGMEGRCAGSCASERENGAETRADSAVLGGPGIFT